MRYNYFNLVFVILFLCQISSTMAQEVEPDFVGEAYICQGEESKQMDKEIAVFTSGMSWTANNALSLEVHGGKAKTRVAQGDIKLIVRAADNNSDPASIIRVYRFNEKKKKRTTVLSVDTFMKSRNITKNQLSFSGRKFGESSYILTITNVESGEYGIIVNNPNSLDQKQTIISCFGVD